MVLADSLACYNTATVTAVKSLIVLGPGDCVIKVFAVALHVQILDPGNPFRSGRLSTVDLLVLTSLD
jgi:hypothetical protein